MTEKQPELPSQPLLCPFCGSQAEFSYDGDDGLGHIECTNIQCLATMTGDCVSVFEKWNKRTIVINL